MTKKIISAVALLVPLGILFATDKITFAFVKSLREKPLVSYVKIINWFGDGGLLLIFCLVLYAWGHTLQWDPQRRGEALKEVVRAPLSRKGKSWKGWLEDVGGKLYLFFQSTPERAAFQGALALVLSGIIARILKFLVGRPRPSAAALGIEHWGPSLSRHFDSFPSGHSTSAFAFAAGIAFYYPVLIPPLFIMAILVALARVYLGHHYFSDVYGGALVGILSGFLARGVLQFMERSVQTSDNPGASTATFLDKEG